MLNCAATTAWGIDAPAARVPNKVLGPALVVRDNQASGRQDSAPGFGVIPDNRASWEGFAGFTAPAGVFGLHCFNHVFPLVHFVRNDLIGPAGTARSTAAAVFWALAFEPQGRAGMRVAGGNVFNPAQ